MGTSCANLLIVKILYWGIAAKEEIYELDWNIYLRRTPHGSTREFEKEQPRPWVGASSAGRKDVVSLFLSKLNKEKKTIRGTKKITDKSGLQLPG